MKIAWVAARALKHAPLKGDLMAQWICDAFDGMDEARDEPAIRRR